MRTFTADRTNHYFIGGPYLFQNLDLVYSFFISLKLADITKDFHVIASVIINIKRGLSIYFLYPLQRFFAAVFFYNLGYIWVCHYSTYMIVCLSVYVLFLVIVLFVGQSIHCLIYIFTVSSIHSGLTMAVFD